MLQKITAYAKNSKITECLLQWRRGGGQLPLNP